jgi:hypothetical protein
MSAHALLSVVLDKPPVRLTSKAGMAAGLRPMWSTGSTSIMSSLPLLAGIESITIMADHDPSGAGEKAPRAVEERWRSAGREAHVFMPDEPGDP